MKRLRHSLLSLVAFALLACSTAFVAHLHKGDALSASSTADHCELCLQVTPAVGTSGKPPQAHAPLQLAYAALPSGIASPSTSLTRSAHRARAPPPADTTA
ncbi:MAG: hypothetical protein NT064_03870 [Proteobacteria bacterium]|nr:hypothetical protein [Pseudomonadota bacterium]